MATERIPNNLAGFQRIELKNIFDRIGRADIIWKHKVVTLNDDNRLKTVTWTNTTKGDLQFVTYADKKYTATGVANLGDGIFYTEYDIDIDENDEINVGGTLWRLTKKVEAETTQGFLVYQAWVAVKIPNKE